jgi:hypothetical protein
MILIPLLIEKYIYSPADLAPLLLLLTFYISTKSNLNFDIYLITDMSELALYKLLAFHVPNPISNLVSLGHIPKYCIQFEALCDIHNKVISCFEELLTQHPTLELKTSLSSFR